VHRRADDESLEQWQSPNVSEQYKEPKRSHEEIRNTIICRESLLLLVEYLLPI